MLWRSALVRRSQRKNSWTMLLPSTSLWHNSERVCGNMRLSTSFSLLAGFSRNLLAIASESPFAISVSPTTVYASHFNAANAIEILKYPTTKAFHDRYKMLVLTFGAPNDDQHNMHREQLIINSTLKPAIKAWADQLGLEQFPDVNAFFISSVFDWTFRTPAAELVFPPYTPERASKEGPAQQAAYAAYGFLECRDLGRRIEECNEDGPTNLILTLEYEKEYLYVWVQSVEFEMGICPVLRKRFVRALGESYREVFALTLKRSLNSADNNLDHCF
jgi:hypothetical protein